MEEEESKLIVLREAIREGLESGIADDFDPVSYLEKIKAKQDLDGKV